MIYGSNLAANWKFHPNWKVRDFDNQTFAGCPGFDPNFKKSIKSEEKGI